jgi:uncharacterized membrane protein
LTACSSPMTGSETDASVRNGSFPCDVEAVIKSRCLRCHSDPPVMNAPFPLTTYPDTQADVPGSGMPIWKEMALVITSMDMMPAIMPPTPPFLTDTQQTTLLDWIDAGAPPANADGGCN